MLMARSRCFNGCVNPEFTGSIADFPNNKAMDDWDCIVPLLQRIRVDV
jgi:hypothetical protein